MTTPQTAVVDGVDVDDVVAAALTCPDVRSLVGTTHSGVATYVPGRVIDGVSVSDDGAITVSVEVAWGFSAAAVHNDISLAVGTVAPNRRIDVIIAAIADPDTEPERPAGTTHQVSSPAGIPHQGGESHGGEPRQPNSSTTPGLYSGPSS